MNKTLMQKIAYKVWYSKLSIYKIFYLFSWVYLLFLYIIFLCRYLKYRNVKFDVKIHSITNITVGGNAKTPTCMAMAKIAANKGLSVGIISRGYGRIVKKYVNGFIKVEKEHHPSLVGDEPLLMALNDLDVYVVDDPVVFLQKTLNKHDLWICDDLWSRLFFCSKPWWVLDEVDNIGNGMLLPVGPLRFPVFWQNDNLILTNSKKQEVCAAYYVLKGFTRLYDRKFFKDINKKVTLITATAKPHRIKDFLLSYNFDVDLVVFADHSYIPDIFDQYDLVCVTHKDAVKIASRCQNIYIIDVDYVLNEKLINKLTIELNK